MKRRTIPVLGATALVACSAGLSGPVHRRASLLAEGTAPATYPSPATWRFHPPHEAKLGAPVELGDGRKLYAGENGERWLVDEKRHTSEAAARLAPENLVSILKLDGGGWLFVGESGTGYEAREPIGPFVRASAPLDPLARTSAAAGAIIGVRRRDAALVRSSDAGASWQEVGPQGAHFADVALLPDGRGLAVAVPEALYATTDKGGTWKHVDVPAFGATGVERVPPSTLDVLSVLGKRRWAPGSGDAFTPVTTSGSTHNHKLPIAPARGPDAAAINNGRAAVIDGRYVELAGIPKKQTRWEIVSGPFAGRLEERELPALDGCHDVRLAGHGRYLYVACARASGAGQDAQSIEILRSEDAGQHFKREPYAPKARLSDLALAVGAGGAVTFTGVCPPQAADRGCSPGGVYYRRATRPKPAKGKSKAVKATIELAPSATPSLNGSALALVFSVDGRIAYAVGHRTKDGSLAVFTSHDGGRTFDAHEIDQLPPEYSADDYSNERYGYPYQRNYGALAVTSAAPAEDGTLALVLTRYSNTTLVVTDDEGRAISIAHAPDNSRLVAAAGTRAIAISPRSDDAWESLDGGASWDPIGRLPVDVCKRNEQCAVDMSCWVGGCVIGGELSRIGWRGQLDDDQGVLAPPQHEASPIVERKLRTALSCSLDEGGWHRLAGVDAAPVAKNAALGKVVWYANAVDPDTASASVAEGFGGAHPRVDTVSLLPAARRPESMAFAADDQVEGLAAVRYATPEVSPGGTHLSDVELGWVNLFEGRVGHARIADGGVYVPGDYVRGSSRSQMARPALLSVSTGGIFLRIHAQSGDAQPTIFADGRSTQAIPPVPWPASSQSSRSEMVRLDSTSVPVRFIGAGVAVIRAHRADGAWTFDAFATGLEQPSRFGEGQSSDLTYVGTGAALSVITGAPGGDPRSARVFPLRAQGAAVDAPIPVPTELDYHDRAPRCSATQRSSTPRVVQPYFEGTRHAVMVTDASEPVRLLVTSGAVMYGTPKSPCVAAFDAEVVPLEMNEGRTEGERAILPTDDLEHAWLFRNVSDARGAAVEYRNMSCRYDPTVEVPAEAYSVSGATIRR